MLPLIDTQISTAVDHFQCFSGSNIHNMTRIKHSNNLRFTDANNNNNNNNNKN